VAAKPLPSSKDLEGMLERLYIQLLWKRREKTHLSDLDTPRRSLYNRLYPEPPSFATVLNFVRGESSHSYFRDVLGQLPEAIVEAGRVDISPLGNELLSHTDTLFPKCKTWPTGIVWEFKSTMGVKPKTVWVKRTHSYMALHGITYGVLAVHYLMQNRIKCYPMQLPEWKLAQRREGLLYLTDLFVDGLERKKNPFPQCFNCAYVGAYCEHRERCKKDGFSVPERFGRRKK